MTTNIGGYDDFVGPLVWRDSDWTESVFPVAAGNTLSVLYDRGSSFATMTLRILVGGQPAKLTIRHFRQNPEPNPVTTEEWILNPNQAIYVTTPMLLNYLNIFITASPLGATSVTVKTQQGNFGTDQTHYYAATHEIGAINFNIANGATADFIMPNLVPGPGHLYFRGDPAAANLSLRLSTYDLSNNELTRCYELFTSDKIPFLPIVIPHSNWTARLVNNSGVAQTVSFSVLADGR